MKDDLQCRLYIRINSKMYLVYCREMLSKNLLSNGFNTCNIIVHVWFNMIVAML